MNATSGEKDVRIATPDDAPDVIALLREVMGWDDDSRVDEFFAWKHELNHFGRSPAWVGTDDDGRIVAVRLLLRWRFVVGGRSVDAVRAVDTATHPSQQGRGWFTRLTKQAMADLREDGVSFIFNTPNDRSWPGYEKMGWRQAPTPLVAVLPRHAWHLRKLVGAKVPAQKWATPVGSAPLAADLISGTPQIGSLVDAREREVCETERSLEYLAWRYGLRSLGYQALTLSTDPTDGVAIYRVRQRGTAREASICELLVPRGQDSARRHLVRKVLADSRADFALVAGRQPGARMIRVPRIGPRLTVRDLASEAFVPSMQLGDLELF